MIGKAKALDVRGSATDQAGALVSRAWLRAPKNLGFKRLRLDPTSLGPTDIYALTEYSAVSIGTEVAAYAGKEPLRPGRAYPRLLGYSNVARVVRVGSAVKGLKLGDRIFTNQSHQSAFICDQDATLATIPGSLSPAASSLVYIANLSLSSFQRTQLRKGETVAILGLGPIGLAGVAIAKAMGARVIAIGNAKYRLEKAQELGADLCFSSDDSALFRKLEKHTGRRDVDLVLTTVNPWDGWLLALRMPRYGGRIAVLGFPGRGDGLPRFNPLEMQHTYVKQLRIYHCGLTKRAPDEQSQGAVKANLAALLKMMAQGMLPLEKILTHQVPWNELERIYELALQHDKRLIGAVLVWKAHI